jgi:hypothetical protein
MKKLFYCGVAAALIGVATLNVALSKKSETKFSDLQLLNIEVLASGESGGTPVRTCFQTVYSSPGTGMYYQPCDSLTTESMIYDCPAMVEGLLGSYSSNKCKK